MEVAAGRVDSPPSAAAAPVAAPMPEPAVAAPPPMDPDVTVSAATPGAPAPTADTEPQLPGPFFEPGRPARRGVIYPRGVRPQEGGAPRAAVGPEPTHNRGILILTASVREPGTRRTAHRGLASSSSSRCRSTEFCHALAAYRLGDATASSLGLADPQPGRPLDPLGGFLLIAFESRRVRHRLGEAHPGQRLEPARRPSGRCPAHRPTSRWPWRSRSPCATSSRRDWRCRTRP